MRRQNRDDTPGPEAIIDLAFGFWGAQAVMSAVELGVFRKLAEGPSSLSAVCADLGIARGGRDLLDFLVVEGLLERSPDGCYSLSELSARHLDESRPGDYLGGLLLMGRRRLYPFWGRLTEALRTGRPQNEAAADGGEFFSVLYADENRLADFLRSMSGRSMGAIQAMARAPWWADVATVADVGCGRGTLIATVLREHPRLTGTGFDLPAVRPVFDAHMAELGVSERSSFVGGDFWTSAWPGAEVIVLGHVLHDWGIAEKQKLLGLAYDALPAGGRVVVHEAFIDDDRRVNGYGMLMSLNMAIETEAGFDFTAADCTTWLADAGFVEIVSTELTGHESMIVARKPGPVS